MKLSANLSLAEMISSDSAKRNGIDNNPTKEHLANLKLWASNIFQPIRDHFGRSIYVSSGYRSKALNKFVGGSQTSQHSRGEAGDIDMDGSEITNLEIFMFIKDNLEFDQLIWEFGTKDEPDWVHVSYSSTGKQRKQVLVSTGTKSKPKYSKY